MTPCVFCDFSKITERTVAIQEGFNVVATLGQITNGGYLLLIPFRHATCLGSLSKKETNSLTSVLQQTISVLEEEYETPVTIFEHGIVGQTINHAHLHVLPSSFDLTQQILSDFPEREIQTISSFQELRKQYKKRNEPYLFWSTPSNEYLVCWNPPAKPEYLRIVAAELLGAPERASWRQMDPVLDKQLSTETVNKLTPLFTY